MQGLPGLTALVELPAHACAVSIKTAFSFLLKALGVLTQCLVFIESMRFSRHISASMIHSCAAFGHMHMAPSVICCTHPLRTDACGEGARKGSDKGLLKVIHHILAAAPPDQGNPRERSTCARKWAVQL